MKSNEFVTSDLHFGHKAMLNYRPFETTDEMDQALIENWNAKVPRSGAIVYVLGDFAFRSRPASEAIIGQLNGRIRFVQGNHDRGYNRGRISTFFDWVRPYYESRTETGTKVVMCHYAFRVWNEHHYGSWNLHGHSHGNLPDLGRKQIDVGVDARENYGLNNFEPWSFEEVKAEMAKRTIHTIDHHRPKDHPGAEAWLGPAHPVRRES